MCPRVGGRGRLVDVHRVAICFLQKLAMAIWRRGGSPLSDCWGGGGTGLSAPLLIQLCWVDYREQLAIANKF